MASLLFFGRLSEIAPNREIILPDAISDTSRLQQWLSQEHEGFAAAMKQQGARIAVNKSIISDNHPITDTDEIAFMSALSGG